LKFNIRQLPFQSQLSLNDGPLSREGRITQCCHLSVRLSVSLSRSELLVPEKEVVEIKRSIQFSTETVRRIYQTPFRQSSASRPRLRFRSSSSTDYVLPRLHTKFGERAFSYAGQSAWNRLPEDIRAESDIANFRKLLKTHYFNSV